MSDRSSSAADLLLYMTHQLLQDRWTPLFTLPSDNYHGASSLELFQHELEYALPTSSENILVRGISVCGGTKLFVHFVRENQSTRLALRVSDYVSKRVDNVDASVGTFKIEYKCGWRCNKEVLQWRLDRELFPQFNPTQPEESHKQDAELSRLSSSLLDRISLFLRGHEFARLTQTNKTLHELDSNNFLWDHFLHSEFPFRWASTSTLQKEQYKSCYKLAKREKAEAYREAQRWRQLMYNDPPIPLGLTARMPLRSGLRIWPNNYNLSRVDDDDDLHLSFERHLRQMNPRHLVEYDMLNQF